MNEKQVAELFIEQHVLQPSQAEDVLNEANLNGKSIVEAMVDGGFVDENSFYLTIATALGVEYVDLGKNEIPPAILKLIPSGLARLHRALPIGLSGNTLRVALADPLDPRAAEDLRFALGKAPDEAQGQPASRARARRCFSPWKSPLCTAAVRCHSSKLSTT